MTKQVQIRRGTATQHTSFTGAEGEISINTTNDTVHVHDGLAAGGVEMARSDLGNVLAANVAAALAGSTLSSITLTTADINGGTIDGTIIGNTTPAAGNFTSGSFTGDLSFGDNAKAIFGAGSDLQIYHDGTHSYLLESNGTGNLYLGGDNLFLTNAALTSVYLKGIDGGATELRHNNSQKLATTATGVDVTGTVTADGLTVDGTALMGTTSELQFFTSAYGIRASTGLEIKTGDFTRFLTGATERMRITSGGEVQIGTSTSDTNKLFVYDSDASNSVIYVRQDGAGPIQSWHGSGGQERMRIDSSGNVGIGTSSPSAALHVVDSSGDAFVKIEATENLSSSDSILRMTTTNTSASAKIQMGDTGDVDIGQIEYDNGDNSMRFQTNATERMRIDSSGNVLVGTTTTDPNSTAGAQLASNGRILATVDGGNAGYFNRLTSDGELVRLEKDGTAVGSIGVEGGDNFYITDNNNTGLNMKSGLIIPCNTNGSTRDNAIDLGASGGRFKDLYLGGGVYLGGTGSANHLDDYEEGTLTMSSFLTVNGLSAVSHNYALYTKVGNLVHIQGNVNITPSATGTISWVMTTPFDMNQNSGVGQLGTMSAYPYSTNTATGYAIDNSGLNSHQIYCELNITSLSANNVSYSLTYRTA